MAKDDLRTVLPSHGWCSTHRLAIALISLSLLVCGPSADPAETPSNAQRRAAKIPIPIKILRYSQRLVEKYDGNGDGRLDESEWSHMQGNPRLADLNRDQAITVTELAERVARYGRRRKIRLMPTLEGGRIVLPSLLNPSTTSDTAAVADGTKPPPGDGNSPGAQGPAAGSASRRGGRRQTKFYVPRSALPPGLPAWFRLSDADGDAQLTVAEFAPKATQSQLDDFATYDRNGDGVITAAECARGPKRAGAEAEQETAEEVADETAEDTEDQAVEEAAQDTADEAAPKAASSEASPKKQRSQKARQKKRAKKPV